MYQAPLYEGRPDSNLHGCKIVLSSRITSRPPVIKNLQYPICANCINFIGHTNNYPYDPIPENIYGKCKKFGDVNIVTGDIQYDFAQMCRKDDKNAG